MLLQFFAQRCTGLASPSGVWCGPTTRVLASGRQVPGNHMQIMSNHAQSDQRSMPAVPR